VTPVDGDQAFADRRDAGRKLAAALGRSSLHDPIVLALPRGGVPVGFEVAMALDAPLDLMLVRKIGAPGHPELALGAVTDGAAPMTLLNDEVLAQRHPPSGYVESEATRELAELERRRRHYLGDRPPPDLAGRDVILVDDGVATGASARAALRALRRLSPRRVVLAVPVGPAEAIASLRVEADEVVCLLTPRRFYAVGEHYRRFEQTADEEVVDLLDRARRVRAATTVEPAG
jgi:putative phosphoribosyl transferase